MSQVNDILLRAKTRAETQNVPYSGLVTPPEAYTLLQALPKAVLVDVRTHAEWQFVGVVPQSLQIEWKCYPGMTPNERFLTQLKHQAELGQPLFFLCRSGARSHEAASFAAAHGYSDCFNVLEGFEGDKDANGHRGKISGWKAKNLPWVQG